MDLDNKYSELNTKYKALQEENRSLKNYIALSQRKEQENIRREENKDIDFGRLLNAAVEHQTTENDILKLMTYGTRRVISEGVEVALFQMREIGQNDLEIILNQENMDRTDLVTQERVLYCLIDTEIGDEINSLEEIKRYLTLKKGTILGDTDLFGEGVVSVSTIEDGEAVKNFHYGNYQTGRWRRRHLERFGAFNPSYSENILRVSFPIYHTEAERLDEIQYILLVRNVKDIKFSNYMIRAIRGYGNYGTLALALKQLQVKEGQILEKDRFIEEQGAIIVSGVRRYLHNLATPLATMENIVNSLNDIIRDETNDIIAQRYSVLLTQVHKVKDSLHRIRETIKRTKYYQASCSPQFTLEDARTDNRTSLDFDQFLSSYLKTVDLEEAYSSRLRFELETGAANKHIMVDKERMAYILDNAIRNTFQQSEKLGISEVVFEIRTIFSPSKNAIVLLLRDYAGGMTEEQYEAYKNSGKVQTTKASGTGEGIPTIIENLKSMGGKDVELYNFPMDGILYTATFSICNA